MIMLWLVSDNVVITVYNVYVCISLVNLTFSFLFFRLFAAGFIIPVNKDYQKNYWLIDWQTNRPTDRQTTVLDRQQ